MSSASDAAGLRHPTGALQKIVGGLFVLSLASYAYNKRILVVHKKPSGGCGVKREYHHIHNPHIITTYHGIAKIQMLCALLEASLPMPFEALKQE